MRETDPTRRLLLVASLALVLALPAFAQPGADSYAALGEARRGDPPLWPDRGPGAGFDGPTVSGICTQFTDRATFEAAHPGMQFENFEDGNVPPFGVTTCSDPYDSTTDDDCWDPGDVQTGISIGSSSGTATVILGDGFIGNPSITTGANSFSDTTEISFPAGVAAVGLDVVESPRQVTVDVLVSGIVAASFTVTSSETGTFIGIDCAGNVFDQINLTAEMDLGEQTDNLQYGSFGGDALGLTTTGTCPGEITLEVVGGTAGGTAAILTGSAGSDPLPAGPCADRISGLSGPAPAAGVPLDASGAFSRTLNVPASACGLVLQALDVTTCRTSNTDSF